MDYQGLGKAYEGMARLAMVALVAIPVAVIAVIGCIVMGLIAWFK